MNHIDRPARSSSSRLHVLALSLALLVAAAAAGAPAGPPRARKPAGAPKATPPPTGAPAPAVIAAVNGTPITQEQFDRLAQPYFEEVHAKANRDLTTEETGLLKRNVLEELIRERLWIAAARAQGMTAPPESVDARMRLFTAFRVNGRVDEARFQAFKSSPTSNYALVRSELEQGLLLEAYRRWMERRFSPAESELRKTFRERTTQATIRYFWLTPEAVSLDPEATREGIRAYYDAHPEEFQTPDEARLTYVRFAVAAPAGASDSVRAAADRLTLEGARTLLVSLRAGQSLEEAARVHGGANDTGWFRLGDPIRGLGRADLLVQAVRGLKPGEWVADPVKVGTFYVIARMEDRHPPRLRPYYDVVGLAKRRADAIVLDAHLDSLARIDYGKRPEAYRTPRLTATVLMRPLAAYDDARPLSEREIQKALESLRRRQGVPDTARAWADSVLAALPAMVRAERRDEAALRAMHDVAERLKRGERPEDVAARAGADVSKIELYKGEPPLNPSLVQGTFLDSLYSDAGGTVAGPRVMKDSVLVVKVISVDPTYLPPFEAVRTQARSQVQLLKQQDEARLAREYFEQHRQDYKTPQRWVFDYVFFRKASPDSVAVPPESLRAYYDAHPLEFTVPGRIHARHILISTRTAKSAREKEAMRAKAAAILKRLKAGEDFAALARELSDDRGTAGRGGDLGWIGKTDVVPEFGNAAFALDAGQTSELVESQYGYHIIRVDEKKPQALRPFEDCRSEIQTVLGGTLADSLAIRAASAFADSAARPGADFAALAAAHGGARESPPLAARQELPGVGMMDMVDKEIGSLPVGGVTRRPVAIATGYVVARLVRSVPPDLAAYAEVGDRVMRDWQISLRRVVADSLDVKLRASLRAGANLDSILVPLGGLRVSRAFGTEGPIPDLSRDPSASRDAAFLARVFTAKPGAVLPPLSTTYGTVYAALDSLHAAPAAAYNEKARQSLRDEVLDQRIEAWTDRLRSKAKVEIYRRDLRS